MSVHRQGLRYGSDILAIDKRLPGMMEDDLYIRFSYPSGIYEKQLPVYVSLTQVGGMGYNNESIILGRISEKMEVPRLVISPYSRVIVRYNDLIIGNFRYKRGGMYVLNVVMAPPSPPPLTPSDKTQ